MSEKSKGWQVKLNNQSQTNYLLTYNLGSSSINYLRVYSIINLSTFLYIALNS